MTKTFADSFRHTKILPTLGPSTSTKEKIHALVNAGANVFRLNFSHGSHDDHRERMRMIREVEAEIGRPLGVLADLQGPKHRVGTFAEGPVELLTGKEFRLDLDATPGNAERVNLPHAEILAALKVESRLLVDDGKIELRVIKTGEGFVHTVVVIGGKISNRKGVNVPDVHLPQASLTPKDLADLPVALEMGADWIALSFVQHPDDIRDLRARIGNKAGILAKIEKPMAIEFLDEIVELSDAVMVARGDLAVEMPLEVVPGLQKRIIRVARKAGKPVVVATQMLESMITSPSPTRAEASDVATAVYGGADAIMLSAESASGDYPIEAVEVMNRIALRVEHDETYRAGIESQHPDLQHTAADAITAAAHQVTETMGAVAIVTYTTTGSTTLRAARERPNVPVVCLTPSLQTARRLTLSSGVHVIHGADAATFQDMIEIAERAVLKDGIASVGEKIVITAGVPCGVPGTTNTLHIVKVSGRK